MDLLDRYLNAVRFWLPADQEDDIIAELSDDIRAEAHDRESDLGRSLTEAEIAAILKRRGDPVLVATGYLDIKPLINASLLPVYWFVVRLVTLWILVPCFILVVGPIEMARSTNAGFAWLQTIWNLMMGQVFAFGVITMVFMCLDRSPAWSRAYARSAKEWDPRQLPALPQSTHRPKAPGRSTALTELIASAIFALIWLTVFWGNLKIHLDSVEFSVAPVWLLVRWMVLMACLASICVAWFCLVRPYAVKAREWMRLVIDAWNLAVIGMLLFTDEWIILTSVNIAPSALASAVQWTNFGIRISLGIAALITGYSVVDKLLRLSRNRSGKASFVVSNITA